jgi:hypothetical protein
MSTMSELVDFLMGLMRSDDSKAAFEQNPEATLAKHNLQGVTGQDVRDARLMMCDDGGIRPHGTSAPVRHDDPVREIRHTTENFHVDQNITVNDVDQTFNLFTIEDSFNSNDNNDIRTVAIQDNDTINDTVNDNDTNTDTDTDTDTTIQDSLNSGTPAADDPVEQVPGDRPIPTEPLEDDPVTGIDPVEEVPGDEPIPTEPLEDDPITGIDPIDEAPIHEPIEDEPELAHADAAII